MGDKPSVTQKPDSISVAVGNGKSLSNDAKISFGPRQDFG